MTDETERQTRDPMQDQTTDQQAPGENPSFETDTVDANLAVEQGLGVGERELQAQRDPGGIVTPDEDDAEIDIEDDEDETVAAQGDDTEARPDNA